MFTEYLGKDRAFIDKFRNYFMKGFKGDTVYVSPLF